MQHMAYKPETITWTASKTMISNGPEFNFGISDENLHGTRPTDLRMNGWLTRVLEARVCRCVTRATNKKPGRH